MNRTTDDLKRVLVDISDAAPLVGDLAAAAESRGQAIRRRRSGLAAAAVALAVGAVVVPNLPGGTTSAPPVGTPTPSPTRSADDDQPLPEYLRGGRLVASVEETNREGVSLTFTPSVTEFGFVESCSRPDSSTGEGNPPMAVVDVNGRPASGTSCGRALSTGGDGDFGQPHGWQDYGVTVGEPVTVTMGPGRGFADLDGGTTWRLAVYEAVPLNEYPFPDPPDQLLTLDKDPLGGEGRRLLWGDGSAYSVGFTYTVPVRQGLELRVETVEPGELRMLVDGVVRATYRSWTYEQEGYGAFVSLRELGIEPGDEVKISFQTERFTGNNYRLAVYDTGPTSR